MPGAVADVAWRCLQNAAHFPQLWLAAESPAPRDVSHEAAGILAELYAWLYRYRRAIKLVERCSGEWPEVTQVFERRFWRGGVRRVADYLRRRMREGALPGGRDPLIAAHLVIEALCWLAVHRHWSADGAGLSEEATAGTGQQMLLASVLG